MAKRTGSRVVKKVRHAKKDKDKVSAKKGRAVAAKPAESQSGGKVEHRHNESRSVEAEAPKAKPTRPRFGPAAKAKITQSKGASVEVKTVDGKSTLSRPDGEAKSTAYAGQPVTSRATARSEGEDKARASAEMNAAKGKSTQSRPGGEAKGAPHADQPAKSRATAKAKIKKKDPASVEAAEGKAEAAVSRPRGKARRAPRYLAAELGQPVDHEGEPVGAGSALVESDADLQAYSLRLWRQMQSGGGAKGYVRAIERAGLTIDEVWTVGITDIRSTSSTPDELRRYQQKLLFRANLLEAILSETVAELHRLPGIETTPPDKAG